MCGVIDQRVRVYVLYLLRSLIGARARVIFPGKESGLSRLAQLEAFNWAAGSVYLVCGSVCRARALAARQSMAL